MIEIMEQCVYDNPLTKSRGDFAVVIHDTEMPSGESVRLETTGEREAHELAWAIREALHKYTRYVVGMQK
jgi:hypothetical protein